MSKKTVKKDAPAAVPTIVFMAESNWNEKHVKPVAMQGEKDKSSRAAFMHHVKAFDGKPVADWAAAVAKKPPAIAKGKNAYTAKQWITWFVKAGVVEVHDA